MTYQSRDPKPIAEFPRPDNHFIERFLFTPDSKQLVTYGKNQQTKEGFIDFYNIETHKLVRSLKQPASVAAVVFTPDGMTMITAGWDNKMRIFAAPKWEIEHTFDHDPPKQTANWLAMFPDGKRFISGNVGYNGPRIWSLKDRAALPLIGPREQANGVSVSANGKRFAVAYSAPVVEISDANKLNVIGVLKLKKTASRQGIFTSIEFSPDGKTIATGYLSHERTYPVGIWDANTFKKIHDCVGLDGDKMATPASCIAYSDDSKLLIACTGAGRDLGAKIVVWETTTGKKVHEFRTADKGGGAGMALSPNGRWLVHCCGYGILRLWDFNAIRRAIEKKSQQ